MSRHFACQEHQVCSRERWSVLWKQNLLSPLQNKERYESLSFFAKIFPVTTSWSPPLHLTWEHVCAHISDPAGLLSIWLVATPKLRRGTLHDRSKAPATGGAYPDVHQQWNDADADDGDVHSRLPVHCADY